LEHRRQRILCLSDARNLLRSARDEIQKRTDHLITSGMLQVLDITRRNLEMVLDNLIDGVMVYTRSRQISFFNKAAESITGINREEVLGHDCREVFQSRLCGHDCECQDDRPRMNDPNHATHSVPFLTRKGHRRSLKMSALSAQPIRISGS
jgi:PAS domain S-box-containing protein